ncbi:D-glucuronyl C5-epimerase family protein [Streptomyces asoensis]|uniref:D-glucuronyl C5-epimerase family protein n=1 Tax=Streptomyces asoensis TaxID=249586 RepID=UPI0033F43484
MQQAGYRLVTDLPEALRPWRDRPIAWEGASPSTGTYHLNDSGVYLYYPTADSEGLDHPVGQIQFGLGCLASYRVETDPARRTVFLARALTQADRLIQQHIESRGWWFGYGFDFTHTTHSGVTYTAPWYSGMAQGEALSLFVQLAAVLPEAERAPYMAAADGAFASLQVEDGGNPWAVNTDSAGYLWIQEYPANEQGTGASDYTFNGMIFAMLGVYDYWCATGDPAAAALYDACATTIAAYWPRLRNPKWYAYYCNAHRIPATTYQQHHIRLLEQIGRHTGSPDFFDHAERLVDDCPAPGVSGTVQFQAGSFTLYRFDTAASGTWVSTKGDAQLEARTVIFSQDTRAPASMRRRIQGRGIYYLISAGAYAGWWVGENWQTAYLLGSILPTVYWPARTLTFPGGSTPVEVCKVAADGTVTGRKTASFVNPSNAPSSQRAIVNGRPQFLISAGPYTGYWVPASAVTADTAPAVG